MGANTKVASDYDFSGLTDDSTPSTGATSSPYDFSGINDAAPVQPTEAQKFYDELARQAGLTGRAASQGIVNIAAPFSNALGIAGNQVAGAIQPGSKPFSENASKDFGNALTKMGIPAPSNSTERVVQDVGSGLTGLGSGMGIAGAVADATSASNLAPYTQKVSNMLNHLPGFQAVSTGSGIGAGSAVRESGGTPTQQFEANLAGTFGPSIATSGTNMFMNALRGSPTQMANNLQAFSSVGATPSLGQATQNPLIQTIESGLSKVPGGASVMSKAGQQQAQSIGSTVDQIAGQLANNPSPENAGRSIINNVNNTFIPQAKAVQQALYDKLDQFIPHDQPIQAANTLDTLNKLTKPISGASALSQTSLINNPTLNGIKDAIESDTGETGALSYQGIKQLRTAVGQKLQDTDLSPDVAKAQWKQLYGALSDDMSSAAKQAGPQAKQAFDRANNYTSALHDRIDTLNRVVGDKDPEAVFQSAMKGTQEGATTLRSVMRSLPEDGQQMMAATVLKRMGRANPSAQNDVGNAFSTNTFLTNWNKLSPEAKSALFGGQGQEFNDSMNNLASVADNLRKGSQVFSNPSGTAGANDLLHMAKDITTAPAAPISYGLAKYLTNPKTSNSLMNFQDLPSYFTNPNYLATGTR